jgi:hypothetical protein
MDTKEARIFDRSSKEYPRIVHLDYGASYPKFIYIKGANGLLRAFKRRDTEASKGDIYRKGKYHDHYDLETGATYAEYEEVDRDILIIESE